MSFNQSQGPQEELIIEISEIRVDVFVTEMIAISLIISILSTSLRTTFCIFTWDVFEKIFKVKLEDIICCSLLVAGNSSSKIYIDSVRI